MEGRATNLALRAVHPGERPFIIARSTFPGSGHWTGHWVCRRRPSFRRAGVSPSGTDSRMICQLGDNYSKWAYMAHSIAGVLQFQLFQIPMVGADTCGFSA